MSLPKLPIPSIIDTLDYETIVARKLGRIKEILQAKGIEYLPNEADDLMTLVEMDAYEEMLLRASLNERIRQIFLLYATGSNLDHIGVTRFGVERLAGVHPTAPVRFTLSSVRDVDTVIAQDTLLGDGESTAKLLQSVIIPAGSSSADGVMALQEFVRSSQVRCETILTTMPWVIKATQLAGFDGGAEVERDDQYRERLWISRDRKSTAGSEMTYRYYAKSADVRVKEVSLRNGGAGIVDLYVLGKEFVTPQSLLDRVNAVVNAEEIRPLTDSVRVHAATVKKQVISATLYAKNVSLVDFASIKARFMAYEGCFGVRLSLPKMYDLILDENIMDVSLVSPVQTIVTGVGEVLKFSFDFHVKATR